MSSNVQNIVKHQVEQRENRRDGLMEIGDPACIRYSYCVCCSRLPWLPTYFSNFHVRNGGGTRWQAREHPVDSRHHRDVFFDIRDWYRSCSIGLPRPSEEFVYVHTRVALFIRGDDVSSECECFGMHRSNGLIDIGGLLFVCEMRKIFNSCAFLLSNYFPIFFFNLLNLREREREKDVTF